MLQYTVKPGMTELSSKVAHFFWYKSPLKNQKSQPKMNRFHIIKTRGEVTAYSHMCTLL